MSLSLSLLFGQLTEKRLSKSGNALAMRGYAIAVVATTNGLACSFFCLRATDGFGFDLDLDFDLDFDFDFLVKAVAHQNDSVRACRRSVCSDMAWHGI